MEGSRRSYEAPQSRVERVRQAICETIAPFDLRVTEDAGGGGEVHSADVGMLRIVVAPGSPVIGEVVRTPRLIRSSDPEMCKIDLQLRGRAVLEQDGRQAMLDVGAFTFVDLSRPCQLAGDLSGVAAVMFPRSLLPLRYRDTRQLAGVIFDGHEANAALVAALLGQVINRLDAYTGAGGARVGAAVFDLITAALAVRLDRPEAISPDARLRTLTWRVKTFIEERLSDPALSPGQVAAAHHVSVRYLYRIFAEQQTTIGAWIRSRRLEGCRRDLTDPDLLDRPVSAVGARWGFVDPTHFGRAFRSAYGVTPSEFRRMCAPSPGQTYRVYSPPTGG
jgi:AraC-like DNA-binding protein